MRTVAALAAFTMLVLAGCGGGGGGASGDSLVDDDDFKDLDATETTGVIRGVVIDEAIRPIAGALVRIASAQQNATTTSDGIFGFQDLDPGTYFLEVSRLGFKGVQQSVEVVAGVDEPPIVKVQLVADPLSLPFFQQQLYEGYISCSFKAANYVFDASSCDPTGLVGFTGRDDANPFFVAERVPDYYQVEITWESTQPAGDELVTIQFACSAEEYLDTGDCAETDTNRLCNVRGTAPLVCRVNATMANEGGASAGGGHGIIESGLGLNGTGFTVGVYANCDPCVPGTILGFGLVLEQQYKVFTHLFYGYEPPRDWLFATSNSVPPPPVV